MIFSPKLFLLFSNYQGYRKVEKIARNKQTNKLLSAFSHVSWLLIFDTFSVSFLPSLSHSPPRPPHSLFQISGEQIAGMMTDYCCFLEKRELSYTTTKLRKLILRAYNSQTHSSITNCPNNVFQSKENYKDLLVQDPFGDQVWHFTVVSFYFIFFSLEQLLSLSWFLVLTFLNSTK